MGEFLNFEEESKKARAFQREKRQELQLIISRCNEIGFNYICVPKEKAKLCFGSHQPRKIPLLPIKTSDMNSFMRRVTKEFFTDPEKYAAVAHKSATDDDSNKSEKRLSSIFASKVPRFQDAPMITGGRRSRKKIEKKVVPTEPQKICFGSSKNREFTLTKLLNHKPDVLPGLYMKSDEKFEKPLIEHSFGGPVKLRQSINIVCSAFNHEICHGCEKVPKNIYWRHLKTNKILCRDCMNGELKNVKAKAKTYMERMRKLEPYKYYEKFRNCGQFYHMHPKNSTAKICILSNMELKKRLRLETYLSKYLED